jgi:hypothetical protein
MATSSRASFDTAQVGKAEESAKGSEKISGKRGTHSKAKSGCRMNVVCLVFN